MYVHPDSRASPDSQELSSGAMRGVRHQRGATPAWEEAVPSAQAGHLERNTMTTAKHQILIVGGGTAGIAVAARMLRKGYSDVAVIEPSSTHYYQPLWTLVGGGQAKAPSTERTEASVMPKKATGSRTPPRPSTRTTTRSPASTGRPTSTTCSWSARASNSTGTAPRESRGRSARTASRRTTGSTWPRAPGISSAPRGRALRCSRCRPGRSSAPARRRRSPTWPATTGEKRVCSTTSTSTSWCRHRGSSASRRSPTTSIRSSPTTASTCTPTPR